MARRKRNIQRYVIEYLSEDTLKIAGVDDFVGIVFTFLRDDSMKSRRNYTEAKERGATLPHRPWIHTPPKSQPKDCYKEICGYEDHEGLRNLRDNSPFICRGKTAAECKEKENKILRAFGGEKWSGGYLLPSEEMKQRWLEENK